MLYAACKCLSESICCYVILICNTLDRANNVFHHGNRFIPHNSLNKARICTSYGDRTKLIAHLIMLASCWQRKTAPVSSCPDITFAHSGFCRQILRREGDTVRCCQKIELALRSSIVEREQVHLAIRNAENRACCNFTSCSRVSRPRQSTDKCSGSKCCGSKVVWERPLHDYGLCVVPKESSASIRCI